MRSVSFAGLMMSAEVIVIDAECEQASVYAVGSIRE